MIKSYGNYNSQKNEFEFICHRSENMQFLFNNLKLELKDHNYAQINPGFVSRTLNNKSFQHTLNSLHFLIEGEAEMDFDGKKQKLTAGDIFIIGNHVKCTWEYLKPSREITLLFNMYLGNLDDLFTSLSEPLIINGRHDTTNRMRQLFEKDGYSSIFEMKNICISCIEEFLEISGTDLTTHIRITQKYEKVFQYITDNLSMNLHIDELAKHTHYSTGFFTKSFVKDNGITVKQYIHDKLMSEAEQLLIYSDLSITVISEKLGFCEHSYFTRWFKKNKNSTPNEYRRKLRELAAK